LKKGKVMRFVRIEMIDVIIGRDFL
jgi:hypothetical protein